jgi:MFS family permease
MDNDAPSRLPFVLRALRHRNYRLFFFGQGLSLLGVWMQNLAMSWLIYRLTGDEFKLGLIGFAGQIPNLVFAPLSGVFADRWDRRKLLVITQVCSLIQASVLSVLVMGGYISRPEDAWYLIGLTALLGMINSVDIPVRQSFIVEMVGSREDIASAIPLNSFLMNMTRFVGPPLAGLVVALWGEGLCFLLNSVSYLAVIAALLAMKLTPREILPGGMRFREQFKEGLSYVYASREIRVVLLFLAAVAMVGVPYMVLMPAFAKTVLHGDARTQGLLMGSVGIGAVLGTLYQASRRKAGLGRIMGTGSIIFGVGLVLFSLCGVVWDRFAPPVLGRPISQLPANAALVLAGPVLMAVGFGQVSQLVSGNTLLQILVEDDKRGRVMSLHTVAFLGMMPIGSLLAGAVAKHIGPSQTVFLGGVLCLILAVLFLKSLASLPESRRESTADN